MPGLYVNNYNKQHLWEQGVEIASHFSCPESHIAQAGLSLSAVGIAAMHNRTQAIYGWSKILVKDLE